MEVRIVRVAGVLVASVGIDRWGWLLAAFGVVDDDKMDPFLGLPFFDFSTVKRGFGGLFF